MALFSLGQLANGERMQYARPSGQSAFLQGMQEAQAVGDLWRKNQLEQTQLNRMETGRGMALGALMNPNDPNAKTQFAQGIAEQGDLKGAQQMIWPNQSVTTEARNQKAAADFIKDSADDIKAYNALKNGISLIPARDEALKSRDPEGRAILGDIMKIVNEYLRMMSGAAVTASEAERLFTALGMEQMSATLIGMEPSAELNALVYAKLQEAKNKETTFNPASVRNELAKIANGLNRRLSDGAEMIRPIYPEAYAMVKESLKTLGNPIPLTSASTQVSSVADTIIDPKDFTKDSGMSELDRLRLIEGDPTLQNYRTRNAGSIAGSQAEATLPSQKSLAKYQNELGIEATAAGIRMNAQEMKDKVALAQAAIKRGGPNALSLAQQHLAGTGYTLRDIGVPAAVADKIERAKTADQSKKNNGTSGRSGPIKTGKHKPMEY